MTCRLPLPEDREALVVVWPRASARCEKGAMDDCVLVAELGPNPAALVECLWALARQRDLRVRAAFVLTSGRAWRYLRDEVLAPGAAYDQLAEVLGEALIERAQIRVTVVRDGEGSTVDDEVTPEASALWNEARWRNAREALRTAGEAPLVFALAGGRRRASSAMTTVIFQLLGRRQDLLVDVRVGDRRVEGGSAGFYFPEQAEQTLVVGREPIIAREVPVLLADVQVPRLRRLLGGREFETWAQALAAGQRAIEEAPTLSITLDVAAAKVFVNDTLVKLPEAEFVWFAALVLTRKNTAEGWLRGDDEGPPKAVLEQMRAARDPGWKPNAVAWRSLVEGTFDSLDHPPLLSKYRSAAVAAFTKCLVGMDLPRSVVRDAKPVKSTQVIDGAKTTCWRLPLDPDSITVREGPR